jgi:aminoglycoside phosphotransferase (APT) family kinase protein
VSATTGSAGWISRWPDHAQLSAQLPDPTEPATRAGLLEHLRQGVAHDLELDAVRRTDGGFSSETWFLEVRVGSGHETLVLRRQATVGPLEPYDVAREVGVLEALAGSRVPVPRIRLFCAEDNVLGAPFVVLERIAGEIPDYRDLPERPRWREQATRSAMGRELIAKLAAIQAVDWRADARLSALMPRSLPPGAPCVVRRVEEILAKLDHQIGRQRIPPPLVEAAGWLTDRAPRGSGDEVLVHGDYRIGNFIWQGEEIVGVLDWEGAGIGDPLEDLGYACHPIMRARAPELMAMLVPFDELASLYETQFGRALDVPRLHYYVIYALYFHLHTFLAGIVAAANGADLRVGLGYAKLHRVATELSRQIAAYEEGRHVL